MRIPFRLHFQHNLAVHRASSNLVVKLTSQEGISGYGEGVPRDFVTGESLADSYQMLKEQLIPQIGNLQITRKDEVWPAVSGLMEDSRQTAGPAACCALELAILDWAGKTWQCSLSDFLPPPRYTPRYSAVLPLAAPDRQQKLLDQVLRMEIPHVKLKVGGTDDLAAVTRTRKTLGPHVDIRLDANGAWTAAEAVENITALLPLGISAVEQPVGKKDRAGLRAVTRQVPIPIIADESLCTREDAARLTARQACTMFNIRISKCGGLTAAMQIYEHARRHGVQSQLGCHVGETGILSAAGCHLAAALDFKYLEGAYGRLLLERDIVHENVAFGPGGVPPKLPGWGLGVTVDDQILQQYARKHCRIPLNP